MRPEQVLAQGYHNAGVLLFVMLAVVCVWAIALWISEKRMPNGLPKEMI